MSLPLPGRMRFCLCSHKVLGTNFHVFLESVGVGTRQNQLDFGVDVDLDPGICFTFFSIAVVSYVYLVESVVGGNCCCGACIAIEKPLREIPL